MPQSNNRPPALKSTPAGRLHTSDALIRGGGALKNLSDKGDFGGYLVRFGSPEAHDLEGDFFTKDTDFWLHGASGSTKVGSEGSSFVLYGHGTDPELGTRRLATGRLVVKDAGVWMETQMQRRNEYEEAIEQLAKQGALGLSSGTAAHLVETERKSGANWIKTWPLGLDASLTPEPAEPRTSVQPLKTSSIQPVRALARTVQGSEDDDLWEIDRALSSVEDRLTILLSRL
jgi:phage head maturation protease